MKFLRLWCIERYSLGQALLVVLQVPLASHGHILPCLLAWRHLDVSGGFILSLVCIMVADMNMHSIATVGELVSSFGSYSLDISHACLSSHFIITIIVSSVRFVFCGNSFVLSFIIFSYIYIIFCYFLVACTIGICSRISISSFCSHFIVFSHSIYNFYKQSGLKFLECKWVVCKSSPFFDYSDIPYDFVNMLMCTWQCCVLQPTQLFCSYHILGWDVWSWLILFVSSQFCP